MTVVYFVRHAEPNFQNQDDAMRELTPKGMEDRKRVTGYLRDKRIDAVLSSPFKRAVDTVLDFAEQNQLTVRIIEDFRERKVFSGWIEDFKNFSARQWADFDYQYLDGESLREVQERNVSALKQVLAEYAGQNVVVGSHGTALCTILHYYDPTFGFADFEAMKARMPWIVRFTFEGTELKDVQMIDVLEDQEP